MKFQGMRRGHECDFAFHFTDSPFRRVAGRATCKVCVQIMHDLAPSRREDGSKNKD
jgi:hypothetical protein